jgi:ABC-type glutathione transport system ATPase component
MYRENTLRLMPNNNNPHPRSVADKVVFDNVSKVYQKSGSSGQPTLAIESLDVAIKKAEIVSILGPTGAASRRR